MNWTKKKFWWAKLSVASENWKTMYQGNYNKFRWLIFKNSGRQNYLRFQEMGRQYIKETINKFR